MRDCEEILEQTENNRQVITKISEAVSVNIDEEKALRKVNRIF